METKQTILSRGLPKTGQLISYFAGDDGDIEAGWWVGKTSVNNLERFIVKTIVGVEVIIDRATGLMWPRDVTGPGGDSGLAKAWSTAVFFGGALIFVGFDDWRLPNVEEFCSIFDLSAGIPCWYPVFLNGLSSAYWTSTTAAADDTLAYAPHMNSGVANVSLKTANNRILCVRGGA